MIQTKLSLPQNYDPRHAYPLILINDGDLHHFNDFKEKAILVGLLPENRLVDYTPWQATAIRSGAEDFGGQADEYHNELFYKVLPELQSKYSIDTNKIFYGGYSLVLYSLSVDHFGIQSLLPSVKRIPLSTKTPEFTYITAKQKVHTTTIF